MATLVVTEPIMCKGTELISSQIFFYETKPEFYDPEHPESYFVTMRILSFVRKHSISITNVIKMINHEF